MMVDLHSCARPQEARVTHVSLDLTVDFEARRLRGRAALDLELASGASRVLLDTRDLEIQAVTDESGSPLSHELGEAAPLFGAPLSVDVSPQLKRIVIHYATSPRAEALQWLEPAQTAGGERPFLFTQGHAILTRTWIPTQDSPAVRQTYDARITVPDTLVALMSAERAGSARAPDGGGATQFTFVMRQPVPPHLIALAVGDLVFRPVGPRTGVFAEPAIADGAARELSEMERMMDAAEAIGGPYRWDRFDVLIMPPSFPYGGMENPRLTFASPSVLAGDRSLVTVIAHELAHAWAGNLVTNGAWDDFWLNEGFTVYFELRINEALWGEERAAMLNTYGFRELESFVEGEGAASPDTRLVYDMAGRDPAVGVTAIPYIKGAALLQAIEAAASRDRFDPWLRGYFDRHAFASITTDDWLADMKEHLLREAPAVEERVNLARWLHEPGMPPDTPAPRCAALDRAEERARDYLAGGAAASLPAASLGYHERRHFLGVLYRESKDSPLSAERLAELDGALSLSTSSNAELLFAWLRLAARSRLEAALPSIERFLMHQGRGKYVRPLFAELLATPWGAPVAARIYAAARPHYHALVSGALDRMFADRMLAAQKPT